MSKEKRRPSWWQLWLLLPTLGILGYFETQLDLSATGRRVVEAGIVLVLFWLVAVWLRANECAMLREIDESAHQVADRQPETWLMLPPNLGISASSNGNGHRRSAWYIPAGQPEWARPFVELEPGDQDD